MENIFSVLIVEAQVCFEISELTGKISSGPIDFTSVQMCYEQESIHESVLCHVHWKKGSYGPSALVQISISVAFFEDHSGFIQDTKGIHSQK